jgi:uncharacterized protein (DUF433 family)
MQKTGMSHPYIERDQRISGGSPIIKGTRVRVVDIAIEYEYMDRTPDDIVLAHPHLELKQVHDALSYYYENRSDLDRKIREDRHFVRQLSRKLGKDRD